MTESFQQQESQSTDQATETETFTSETEFSQPIKVGDRTFSSPQDVAKYYEHSQKFIETLKAEKNSIEQSLQDARKVDDILAKLESTNNVDVKTGSEADNQSKSASNNDIDLDKLLEDKLKQHRQAEIVQQNYSACVEKAKAVYGEKWASILDDKSKELGTNLKQLAETNPKLFDLAVFGKDSKTNNKAMSSSIRPLSTKPEEDFSDITEKARKVKLSDVDGLASLYQEAFRRKYQQ